MAAGRKTGGRTKGTPNKLNAALKDAILNAFETVGGEKYLVSVAKADPRTFCMLLGKVMPTQLTGAGEGPIRLAGDRGQSPREKLLAQIDQIALHSAGLSRIARRD